MRRALNSFAITCALLLVLCVGFWLIVDVIGLEIPESFVTVLAYLLGWPLLLLAPLIPASDSPDPHAPLVRTALYLVALVLDLAAYSSVVYIVLAWRERRSPYRKLNDRIA